MVICISNGNRLNTFHSNVAGRDENEHFNGIVSTGQSGEGPGLIHLCAFGGRALMRVPACARVSFIRGWGRARARNSPR